MWLCGSPSPDQPEFDHFTFLFCREWQKKWIKVYNARAQQLHCLTFLSLNESGFKLTRLYHFKTISKSIPFPSLYTKTICPPFWLARYGGDMFC